MPNSGFAQVVVLTNRAQACRQEAAVPVPRIRTIWWAKARRRLRGEGAPLLRNLTLAALAACALLPFVPPSVVADGFRDALYGTALPSAIGLVGVALTCDLCSARREHRGEVEDRLAKLAEAERLGSLSVYKMRLRRFREENPGLTLLEDGRLVRCRPDARTFEPIELPAELEELRKRSYKPAER